MACVHVCMCVCVCVCVCHHTGLEEEAYAAPDDEDQEADKEVRKQGLK